MAEPEYERVVEPKDRLELLAKTRAKKFGDHNAGRVRCNIIIVPGGSSTSPTASSTSNAKKWLWLERGPDGPAAQLASFLALRNIHTRTYAFNYSIPQTSHGIGLDTVQNLAHDLLDELDDVIPSPDLADDLSPVYDYIQETGASHSGSSRGDMSDPGDARDDDQDDAKSNEKGDGTNAKEENSEDGDTYRPKEDEEVVGDSTLPGEGEDPEYGKPAEGAETYESSPSHQDDGGRIAQEANDESLDVDKARAATAEKAEAGNDAESLGVGRIEGTDEVTAEDIEDKRKQQGTMSLDDDNVLEGVGATSDDEDGKSSTDDDGNDDMDDIEDDKSAAADDDDEATDDVLDQCIFVAQDLGGLLVKEALSVARKTIGKYQATAACTTLLLFYETPCLSALHGSSWESFANGLLCTSRQGMLFSNAWIQNTAHMIESVCADFVLSEPIYHVINVRCSADDLVPFLRQDTLDSSPTAAALMSLGEEIMRLKRTPYRFMWTLNTLALTQNGMPRGSVATVASDAPRRARMEALRKEGGVSAWLSSANSSGFLGFIVPSEDEDEASALFEVLLKDASAANAPDHLRHISALDDLKPMDQVYAKSQKNTVLDASTRKAEPIAAINYVFDPYNLEANTATALLSSLCYQLICLRRRSFAHTSELVFYLSERSKGRIWPFDKLLILFRALLSCPYEGAVACILWEMPGTVLPHGLVSTLAVLASGPGSTFKLAVISSRADVEFPSVPVTQVAPVKPAAFLSSPTPVRGLSRVPTWATDESHVFRLPCRSIDLAAVVDRELALLLGRRPAMRSVQEKLKDIIIASDAAEIFSGSHTEVVASVRAWLELITRRAVPISIASITREAPNMPSSMAGLYAATLSYTPPALLPTLQQLLAWLSLAKRPMTHAELAVALAVTHASGVDQQSDVRSLIHVKTMDELDSHKPVNFQNDILALLGSAVHTDTSGRPLLQAELIDLLQLDMASPSSPYDSDDDSVYKYALPDAHNTLSRICLTFLRICQDAYPRMTPAIVEKQPFFEYAVLHWPYHYAAGCLSHHKTRRSHAGTPSAQSCSTYFEDASLMEFWAGQYHDLRHPGLTPPAENIVLSMAADVGCLDLISHALKYAPSDMLPEPDSRTEKDKGTTATRSGLSRALLYAVQHGDIDAVKLLEEAGAQSPFSVHVAVASNQNALLHHFGALSDVLDLDDWRGYTPTQIAAETGNVTALEALLKVGATAGTIIGDYHYSSDTEDFEVHGWDYDSRYYYPNELPILHIACLFGHVAVVKRLLEEQTIDPNGFDVYYNRPIFYAGLLQQPDAMRALLEDPRTDTSLLADAYNRRSPLQVAAVNERVDMVELSLKSLKELQSRNKTEVAKADGASDSFPNAMGPLSGVLSDVIRITDRFSLTAFHVAAFHGQVNAGRAILSHDSHDLAMQTIGYQMIIPLHLAARNDHTEFMRLLLSLSNAPDQLEAARREGSNGAGGQTALHITALHSNHAASMRLLVDAHVKARVSLDAFDSGPRCALHYAVIRGSAANVRLLLDGGATPDAIDGQSATPLLIACQSGYVDVVRILLGKKADTRLANDDGLTPLLAAAWIGSLPIMEAILDTTTPEAALLEADKNGRNALHYAVMSKSHEAVVFVMQFMGRALRTSKPLHSTVEGPDAAGNQFLYDRGEMLLDNSSGSMPIEAAAESDLLLKLLPVIKRHIKEPDALYRKLILRASSVGHRRNIEALVQDYHADLDAVDDGGRTALSFAAESGRVGAALYLARKTKSGQDAEGETPLSRAVMSGHTGVVRVLLSHGHEAEVNMVSKKESLSPLHHAIYHNRNAVVKLLLKHQADPNIAEARTKNTPLHYAVMYASLEIVKLVANAPGVQGYARNADDRTPMGVAAFFGYISEARALISAGWKSNDRDSSRHSSPLHDAYENSELIKLFVDEGGEDVNALDSKGRTALHLASGSTNGQVSLLLDLGADPMIADDDNQTSLHIAAYYQDLTTFEKMLHNKFVHSLAQLKYQMSRNGENIFDVAVSSDNTAILTCLLDAKDSPFRAVEQGLNGAQNLQRAIRFGYHDMTRILMGRVRDDAKHLADEIKKKHLEGLLKEIFSSTSYTLSDMECLAKELIQSYTETRGGGDLAGREAWPYMLVLDAIMDSERLDIYVRRPFPQLTQGVWAEIRDHNGWTYPQLIDSMEVRESSATPSVDGDSDSLASGSEALPPAEDRLLYGLEEITVTEEDRAMATGRPGAPLRPTSWAAASSHSDLTWRPRPVVVELVAAATTDGTTGETASSIEEAADHETTVPEDETAPKLFATSPLDPMGEDGRYAARADYPIPPNSQYYFSIRVVDEGSENIVGAGVGYGSAARYRMPGWDADTWGFHGDDGGMFHGQGYAQKYDATGLYGTGDVVGVYADTSEHKMFFAINGKVKATGFGRVYGRLYPMVGLGKGASIEATFGSTDGRDPFVDAGGNPLMDEVTEWL